MRARLRNVAFDFLFGGLLVAGALLVAAFLGPTAGGILAGAPIRTGAVIFLQYLHKGLESAAELTRGVLVAMMANVAFALVLYLVLPRYGIVMGFLASGATFCVAAAVLSQLVP